MHHAPSDAPDAEPPKGTDWRAVERDYRTGQWSNRELAAKHGCSHTQVGRRARDEGWKRVAQFGGPTMLPPKPDAPAPAHAPANAPAQPPSITTQLLARQAAPDRPQPEQPLTALDEAFLTEYLRNGQNGAAAYAFCHPGCTPAVASSAAYKLLRMPRIKNRLDAERKRLAEQHQMDRDQLLQEFLAIVRADPNELMQMRSVACSACWGGESEGKGRWVEPDPECDECMGEGNSVPWFADTRKLSSEARALFAGVQVTAQGVKVLTHDKMAALVNIGKILGAYERDNAQKQAPLTEAIAQFVGQLHAEGAGRLRYSAPPQPLHAQKKVQH